MPNMRTLALSQTARKDVWLECSALLGMRRHGRTGKKQIQAEQRTAEFRSESITKGFGFGDFGDALAYPFRFKASLFFGALMYTFFSMGKLASAMGGMLHDRGGADGIHAREHARLRHSGEYGREFCPR